MKILLRVFTFFFLLTNFSNADLIKNEKIVTKAENTTNPNVKKKLKKKGEKEIKET